ncbi:MAG TPA: RNA-binding S4 domain-containing protein [Candidatus Caccosoma faecigallinarum]|uniref:RNA-binding S4 domain-containing protein n=1 Tax=Candidatus Caccosoma faecigallinarum TaxID=2840720 RepID=A0A9D1G8F1_9FIRM|nr:RNA-binding S4 domain-containing protein [Candidatus Caccosoma faecigallinarum]
MRLDKFLKTCRIIKRRTISKEIILFGQVMVNGKIAKPSTLVKENDFITLFLETKKITIQVMHLSIPKTKNDNSYSMYQIIEEEVISSPS